MAPSAGSGGRDHRPGAPHILGLQEALDEQIAYLQAMLPEYRWIGVDRGLGLSEYTPIFYRHRDLSPIASGNFWLTDTPDVPPPPRVEPRRRFRRRGAAS